VPHHLLVLIFRGLSVVAWPVKDLRSREIIDSIFHGRAERKRGLFFRLVLFHWYESRGPDLANRSLSSIGFDWISRAMRRLGHSVCRRTHQNMRFTLRDGGMDVRW
jgi:hypothetical protein